MARRTRSNATPFKVMLGILIGIAALFIVYLLTVFVGALLPADSASLSAIQDYITWAQTQFDFLVANVVGFTFIAAVLGGTGVVLYLANKSK